MLKIARFHGGHTNTGGSCPGCGSHVPRRHAWTTLHARDVYDCTNCGTFEYTNQGASLPAQPPADLVTVLGPLDCIQ